MEEKVINICGKRITEYLLEALSWFNRGGERVILRGIGGNASRAVQIATILQDEFGCEMESSSVNYFTLQDTKTSYLEIILEWKDEKKYPLKYEPSTPNFVDFPVYQLAFDKILSENSIEIYVKDTLLGKITERNGSLSFINKIDKKDNTEMYYSLMYALYRAGMLLPSNWMEITKILSSYDDVILGLDTNILINASISEHLLPILNLYNPINYAHTPNWILFVIPSTVMYELEEFANIRDNHGRIKRRGRYGFRALQEIIELNESYDLSGISIIIVGETDPTLETRAEIQGLRQDLRALLKSMEDNRPIQFSPKSSSGDIIIRDQFKSFLRKIDFHKGVYFLTSDKSNAALADAEGLHSLYMKIPSREFRERDKEKVHTELDIPGEPPGKIEVPVGKLLYELAVEYGEIDAHFNDTHVRLSVDLMGERIDHWINRRLKISKYDFSQKLSKNYKGYVDIDKVMKVWNKIMRNRD